MNNTYQPLYKNEVRPVTISIRKQDHTEFEPASGSTFQVTDCDGNVVVEESTATVEGNTLTAVIDTDVTGTVGDYYIVWKIVDSNDYIYYNKTKLEVQSLLGS